MRFLLDTCVPRSVKFVLVDAGHDAVHAGDWSDDPGDAEILAWAYREKRILITIDKDFGELAIVRGISHAGIIRLVDHPLSLHGRLCLGAALKHADLLGDSGIVTVMPGRLRVRPSRS